MPTRTASGDDDAFGIEETILIINESGEGDIILTHVHTSSHRVRERTRLFEDLLEHEMRVAALLELAQREFEALDLRGLGDIIDGRDIHFFAQAQGHYFFVFDIDDLIRIFDDRRGIGSKEILVLADTDYQR